MFAAFWLVSWKKVINYIFIVTLMENGGSKQLEGKTFAQRKLYQTWLVLFKRTKEQKNQKIETTKVQKNEKTKKRKKKETTRTREQTNERRSTDHSLFLLVNTALC